MYRHPSEAVGLCFQGAASGPSPGWRCSSGFPAFLPGVGRPGGLAISPNTGGTGPARGFCAHRERAGWGYSLCAKPHTGWFCLGTTRRALLGVRDRIYLPELLLDQVTEGFKLLVQGMAPREVFHQCLIFNVNEVILCVQGQAVPGEAAGPSLHVSSCGRWCPQPCYCYLLHFHMFMQNQTLPKCNRFVSVGSRTKK